MKKFSFLLLGAVALLSAFTVAETWKSDKAHSRIGFAITHLGISEVGGNFKDFDVTVTTSKPDFSDASFELTANVASVNTDLEMRDKHLQSADFFDAAKFPTFTFKSTALQNVGANKYKMTGNLTLHGVTKPVTFDVLYRGTVTNPMSKAAVTGFQVTGTIKRSDFGIADGFPTAVLSDEVKIQADGEFGKK